MVAIAEGQVIAGKYRLERPLARGGMGSVWVVRHLPLDALVLEASGPSAHLHARVAGTDAAAARMAEVMAAMSAPCTNHRLRPSP